MYYINGSERGTGRKGVRNTYSQSADGGVWLVEIGTLEKF